MVLSIYNKDQKVHRYEVKEKRKITKPFKKLTIYIFVVGWVLKTLIDIFDLQNYLRGQSCKSKLFLEKLVEQIVTYTYLS